MVGTGANKMPLTKVHPILLGKKKAEGTSLLAAHRQQFQERRQESQPQNHNQMGGGGMRPPLQNQPPNMPPPHMHRQPPGFGGGVRQSSYRTMSYPPPPDMYQRPPPLPFPPPQGQIQPQPPLPGFVPPAQPPPPVAQPPPPVGYPPPPSNSPVKKSECRDVVLLGDTRAPPKNSESRGMVIKKDAKGASTPDGNGGPVKKKRKSRWGAVDDKATLTGPMTTLPANLTEEQRKQYLIQFKIEEITQKLRTGELGIPVDPTERSPSPEPIYNSEGKRLNTREFRVRKQLEEERHGLIKQAIDEIPSYKPPIDYKPPASKICDKVFIPAERNPAVNFIGLLIGPRGNTLKRLEKETGCKIIIRGKGSVKEGKVGRIPGQLMPGEDEPLHALITGPTSEEVKKGVQVVSDIVKEGIECPDAANELRRNQLRELAELNGTLIDDEVIKCKNCGLADHRHWECTERKNVTSEISCTKCGGYGHVAVDCKVKVEANSAPAQTFAEKAKMDTEYMSLMAELGVDAPPPVTTPKRVFQENPTSSGRSAGTTSGTALLPPSGNLAIMPPPNTNVPPPNMNTPPPNMGGPPPNMGGLPPRGAGPNRRGGNSNKWGPPPMNNKPQSLMDLNIDPSFESKFGGPRSDNMRGPGPHGMRGPRPDQPWRNNRGPPPMQQSQNDGGQSDRGYNATPPWQQQGQMRGPPPNTNYPPPSGNTGYGGPPPQSNTRMDNSSTANNAPNQQQHAAPPPPANKQPVSYPPNQWGPPPQNNFSQMPPNSFANLPPHWATQPPPPPPPE